MIRPTYYCDTFIGFSAWVDGEWTPPTTYKRMMQAIADKQSEVLTHDRRKVPRDSALLGSTVLSASSVSSGTPYERRSVQRVRQAVELVA